VCIGCKGLGRSLFTVLLFNPGVSELGSRAPVSYNLKGEVLQSQRSFVLYYYVTLMHHVSA